MPPAAMDRPKVVALEKFTSPEEELAYLRERVAEKERELELPKDKIESERIAKREIAEYADVPAAKILHETVIMAEHETVRHVLKLDPEAHDTQLDGLLAIVAERGIKNALSVAARLKNPHLEDDFHRALVRYIAEGLPDKGMPVPEQINRALHLVLFEVHPQAQGEVKAEEQRQMKLEQLLSSSEQLYAGLLPLIDSSELRGDYNIFNYEGEHAAAYAELANHPSFPIKTPDMFEHDPMNVLLASFAKIAKHG